MSFTSLSLCEPLLRAISEKGYTHPTLIQQQAIPYVLEGRDLLAGSQTGTGKTASFTLPLLHNLMSKGRRQHQKAIRALILTPTRELAAQVEENIKEYGKHLPIDSFVVFGGVSINVQISRLKKGCDVLVATPGRLLDLISQKALDISHVETFILDEADRMLDMGFIHDIKKVMALLPAKRQNLLFSATFSPEIQKLAEGFLKDPALIQATKKNSSAETISQTVHPVNSFDKGRLLSHLIQSKKLMQVLVFTRTKHGANNLVKELIKDGITAAAIHGNKSQGARTKALQDFKLGEIRALVATDIAARGLDIEELPFVVNYELPNVPEDYVHRIGRTGRAGCSGQAVSLVCIDEMEFLQDIEKLLKKPIAKEIVKGFEPDPNIKPKPIFPSLLAKGRKQVFNHKKVQKNKAAFQQKKALHSAMQGHK